MSTRACVELVDKEGNFPVRLYHHSDGYPTFMVEKIDNFMRETTTYLDKAGLLYWDTDTDKVGTVFIMLSLMDSNVPLYPNMETVLNDTTKSQWQKFPYFRAIIKIPTDIRYFYRVFLLGNGKCRIEVFETTYSVRSNRLRRKRIGVITPYRDKRHPEDYKKYLKDIDTYFLWGE